MGALDGIVVLDLGVLVQAPQAATLFADMGATVIKVELPGMGDHSRLLPISLTDWRSPYHELCNRGKRSITVDLRTERGREVLLRLAEGADVMVSNFKPGTLDAWGLGYEVVFERNPRIIYGTGSTFGPIGADAEREGADLAGQAAGGLISTTGVDGGEPTPVGATVADHIASQNLAAGVLAALFVRERTGRGQRVDVSLVGGAIWAQAPEYTSTFLSGTQPDRANWGHGLISFIYGILPTADGFVALVGVPPTEKAKFFTAIGREDLLADARFVAPLLTPEIRKELFGHLRETFRGRTTAEWCDLLRAAGQRFAPVNDYTMAAEDQGFWDNGYFTKIDHHAHGRITAVGTPIRMSETPLAVSDPAPELGQHTEEILLELGYDWDDIGALRDAGAI